MRTLLFLLLPILSYAQDTICIDKARLGRIADTLSHCRQYKQGFIECETLLSLERNLNANLSSTIMQKDTQLQALNSAYSIKANESVLWQGTASEYKQQYEVQEKRLHKARKARKGWTGAALTFLGLLGAGVTTTILILR
jgi:hypothetical protein